MTRLPVLAAILLAQVRPLGALTEVKRFVIVSAPKLAKVGYFKIGKLGSTSDSKVKDLVNSGLKHPQGLAVDQVRGKLFVADPDDSKIIEYKLKVSDDELQAEGPNVVSQAGEARWIAVDSLGSVFFTDEPLNRVVKIPANGLQGASTPQILYDGATVTAVSGPGGIAVDNFFAYWTNKQLGDKLGSVVRGSEVPPATNAADSVGILAQNNVKSYGICVALDNVYYTDTEKNLYAVKKSGGSVVTVSDALTQPRGCSWDGDGTVFVADRGANKVYSFAGNMEGLGMAQLNTAMDFEDAFGVAVFSGTRRGANVLLGGLGALALAVVVGC